MNLVTSQQKSLGTGPGAVLALLFIALGASAQTNVIVTNVVTAAPNFRRVNGQLYNVDRSQLWTTIQGEVINTESNLLIVQTYTEKQHYRRTDPGGQVSTGNFLGTSGNPITPTPTYKERIDGPIIALTNHAGLNGDKIFVQVMKVGAYQNYALYDAGTVNQAVVVTTNSVATKP